jgi:hypothetical protein
MEASGARLPLVSALALLAVACSSRFEGGGDLRARKVVLEREVEGLLEIVGRLERGEAILPLDDVAIAIDDVFVRDLIAAQLPFEADVDRFHLSLEEVEVHFRGSPTVRLRGTLRLLEAPEVEAAVSAIGALEDIEVDPLSDTLGARIAVDHVGIESVAGLESILGRSTLDEVARTIRLQVRDQLPAVQIPVKVQQGIELPAVTDGPVRLEGATMPLRVAVSRVVAGQGRLWVSVRLEPGEFVKTAGR